jgi:hypothetical protein
MGCLLAIILCLSSVSQSPKQHTENKQNAQAQTDKSAANQSITDTGKPPETQFYTYNNQNSDGNETVKEINDYLLAAFTLALVVVGWLQWRVLRKHEEWMQQHDVKLGQLAEAANKNADAARLSAETAEKSLRLAYAAFLGIDPFISPAGAIIIELKNYGRTVARNVTLLGDIADVDGNKVTPFRVEPLIVPTDAIAKAEIGKAGMRQDSYGQPQMIFDLRCNLNVIYEDIFKDTHTRSYVLVFNRQTLKATVKQESS